MIIKNYKIPNFSPAYPIDKLGDKKSILFVDIETTGLSPSTASIYLMGCCYYDQGEWMIRQWLCETPEQEKDLLEAFVSHMQDYKTLIHFHRYILNKCRNIPALGLPVITCELQEVYWFLM